MARCLLSEDLSGRDVVPAPVADRVTALAAQWMEHGFTPQTVRPWADLTPACGAYLAGRGVDPAALDRPIDIGGSAGPVTLRRAIMTGQLDAEQAYDIVSSHAAGNEPEPEPELPQAVFSHPTTDHAMPRTVDRDGGEHRPPTSQPSRTPFQP
jgi:hypothetical protein